MLCRNAYHPDVEGTEDHGSAFMVGKVKDVVPSTETIDRWLVTFSEYALCDFKDNWEGRNPVSYWTTTDFLPDPQEGYDGIDFSALDFKPMPEPLQVEDAPSKIGLTLIEAKEGLARTLGVGPAAVEITIRG